MEKRKTGLTKRKALNGEKMGLDNDLNIALVDTRCKHAARK